MQFAAAKQPLGIVFDTDMGNDVDAVLALALLNGLEGKNECRVISMSTTKTNLKSAALMDIIARFYASASTSIPVDFRRTMPVGMNELGFSKEETPMLTAVLARTDYAAGIATGIKKFNDTAEPHSLIRNMLTAQAAGNAEVVLCGPATNLVRTLALQDAPSIIEKKVKALILTEGALHSDLIAARKLLAEWPTSIVAVGPEIGSALPYPMDSFEKDFGWTTAHPVLDAVKASGRTAVSTSCLAAALYAVREKEHYFKVSDPGTFSISHDGKLSFAANPDGRHRQLVLDVEQHDHILKSYAELVSAKPVPKTFRRPQKDDAKKAAEDAKPDAPKPNVIP